MMNKICPIKKLAASISFSILLTDSAMGDVVASMSQEDINKTTYCVEKECAWWGTTRCCCGILEKI